MKGIRDVRSWETPPFPLFVVIVVVIVALLLLSNIILGLVQPRQPPPEVESNFTYVDGGTEVTVTLVENENGNEVTVRAGSDESWDNGDGAGSTHDDWEDGATLSEDGETSSNLLTRGSGNVTVVATTGFFGRKEYVVHRNTYNAR